MLTVSAQLGAGIGLEPAEEHNARSSARPPPATNATVQVAGSERAGPRPARSKRELQQQGATAIPAPLQSCCTMLAKLVAALISRGAISAYWIVLSALYWSERKNPNTDERARDQRQAASPAPMSAGLAIARGAEHPIIE